MPLSETCHGWIQPWSVTTASTSIVWIHSKSFSHWQVMFNKCQKATVMTLWSSIVSAWGSGQQMQISSPSSRDSLALIFYFPTAFLAILLGGSLKQCFERENDVCTYGQGHGHQCNGMPCKVQQHVAAQFFLLKRAIFFSQSQCKRCHNMFISQQVYTSHHSEWYINGKEIWESS